MISIVLLGLFAAASAQTLVVPAPGSTVVWGDGSAWAGAVAPILNAVVTIDANCSINVDSAVNVASVALGQATLKVNNVAFDVAAVTWNSGSVAVTGAAGVLRSAGAVTVKATATANQQVSGSVDLGVAGSVVIEAGAQLSAVGSTISGGTGVTIAANAGLRLMYSTTKVNTAIAYGAATAQTQVDNGATLLVSANNQISGTGKTIVSGTLETSAVLTHLANADISGVLKTSGTTGEVRIGTGYTFDFKAGSITSTSTATSSIIVGYGAGTGSASLRFSGTTGTLVQGNFEVTGTGIVEIMAGSSARINGPTKCSPGAGATGSGKVIVRTGGQLTFDAATDVQVALESDGTIVFRPGALVKLSGYTIQTKSANTNFMATTGGFTVASATTLALNGAVTVDLGAFTTTTKVKIMTSQQLTGRFTTQSIVKQSAVTIEGGAEIRTYAKAPGAVAIEGNDLYYDPTADPNNPPVNRSGAIMLVPSIFSFLLAVLVAVRML
jgi:hypothetical protein